MDVKRRTQLIRQRSVAKSALKRMHAFIASGEPKVNEIQVIFDRYDTAQNELQLSNDTDHFGDRELCENQYYEVKAKFSDLLHPMIDTQRSRNTSLRSSRSSHSNHSTRSHTNSTHIKLPTIALPPLMVTRVAGYIIETHLRH